MMEEYGGAGLRPMPVFHPSNLYTSQHSWLAMVDAEAANYCPPIPSLVKVGGSVLLRDVYRGSLRLQLHCVLGVRSPCLCTHTSTRFHRASMSVDSSVAIVAQVEAAEALLSCAKYVVTGFRWVCTQNG